ncbi:MAG: PQQ-binding-like beta-propeller repeat protein [Xanthomonadales bacterium]|nr:PQQ-binding-like beta-propeller repeat protein [Xanthomonadales bacterium]
MIRNSRNVIRLALLLVPALVVAAIPPPTPADGGDALVLSPGVLVAAGQPRAYVSDARGRVAAIDLDDGGVLWAGPARGQPLALDGDTLWVLGHPERPGSLRLLRVDAGSGAVDGQLVGELPPEVIASPMALPASRFHVLALAGAGGLELHWQFEQWPLRGANLVAADQDDDDAASLSSGVLRLDPDQARLAQAPSLDAIPFRRPDLTGDERLPDLPGVQFRAADDGHVQTSSPVPDPVFGHRWRWQLHERAGGGPAGASVVATHATSPFLVRGSTLLLREEPVAYRDGDGNAIELGVRLLAMDLATGRQLWAIELADPEHRLPPPP